MELEPRHRAAVERIAERLLGKASWALTGSVAHRLQGVDVACDDVDVQTDEPGAYTAADLLSDYLVEPVTLRRSASITSHFGRLRFDDLDVDVELMGAVDKLGPDGSWTGAVDPSEHLVLAPLGHIHVPVLSLQYEADAYEMIGRSARAQLLRDHLR